MPERKAWTNDEDRVLKFLKDERGQKKWSTIAKLMQNEFNIKGRTGKQCRERYHNHLDSSIISAEWSRRQEQILYQNHESVGNKWSIIAQNLPGRSDNCVKNHFYSKLRKSVRRLNKIIFEQYKDEFTEIKMNLLYKIIQTSEQKFKNNSKINQDVISQCNNIKNQLFKFDQFIESNLNYKVRGLLQSIQAQDIRIKKNQKGLKKHKISIQTNTSKSDIPQNSFQNNVKTQQEEISYYRIIKKICEEILIYKNDS